MIFDRVLAMDQFSRMEWFCEQVVIERAMCSDGIWSR